MSARAIAEIGAARHVVDLGVTRGLVDLSVARATLDLEPTPVAPGDGGESGGGTSGGSASHALVAPEGGVLTLPDAYTIVVDLEAAVTNIVFPALTGDRRIVVYLRQDAIGGRGVAGWPPSVIWPDAQAPQFSLAPGAVDCLVFDMFDSGAIVFGNVVGLGYGPAV